MESGTTANVISDTAVLRGTARTYNEEVQSLVERRLGELATGIARAMRGDAEVNYVRGYPSIMNTEDAVDIVEDTVASVLGQGAAVRGEPIMGGEDFSYLLQNVPGAYFRLGVRNPNWKEPKPGHSAIFDIDEECLPIGAALMAATAARYLES
jgi:metal-dependent amidase/aminoacylase/carboxypeptidase family protein